MLFRDLHRELCAVDLFALQLLSAAPDDPLPLSLAGGASGSGAGGTGALLRLTIEDPARNGVMVRSRLFPVLSRFIKRRLRRRQDTAR